MSEVNRLLHDAEHADSGVMMANMMKDTKSASELKAKARRLWEEAHALDPTHTDDAWQETRLKERP